MENLELRIMAKDNKVQFKDIANELFLNQSYFSQKMNKPLSEKEYRKVKKAILRLIEEKNHS